MKMKISEVVSGSHIGMLDGVVRFERYEDGIAYVSLGRLKNHPVHFEPDELVSVYDVPAAIAPWYGV